MDAGERCLPGPRGAPCGARGALGALSGGGIIGIRLPPSTLAFGKGPKPSHGRRKWLRGSSLEPAKYLGDPCKIPGWPTTRCSLSPGRAWTAVARVRGGPSASKAGSLGLGLLAIDGLQWANNGRSRGGTGSWRPPPRAACGPSLGRTCPWAPTGQGSAPTPWCALAHRKEEGNSGWPPGGPYRPQSTNGGHGRALWRFGPRPAPRPESSPCGVARGQWDPHGRHRCPPVQRPCRSLAPAPYLVSSSWFGRPGDTAGLVRPSPAGPPGHRRRFSLTCSRQAGAPQAMPPPPAEEAEEDARATTRLGRLATGGNPSIGPPRAPGHRRNSTGGPTLSRG